jgi:hypothetical protein
MLPRILVGLSALVILALGAVHLLYTFWGPKLWPRDSALQSAMDAVLHPTLLFESIYLISVGFAMLAGLFLLGKRYWFSVPFRGITFSLVCYRVGISLFLLA